MFDDVSLVIFIYIDIMDVIHNVFIIVVRAHMSFAIVIAKTFDDDNQSHSTAKQQD